MKNKKVWISLFLIIIIISFLIIFFVKDNRKFKFGNNIGSKNLKEIENYILNINSYDANLEVTVNSNKNINKYVIKQQYVSPNIIKQEIVLPENIAGVTINYDGTNLQVINSKLNLNTLYENYEYITDNILWLSSFIEKYKNSEQKEIVEQENEFIMRVKIMQNKYICSAELYIDKKTEKPTRLIVQDENKQSIIYIVYNKIEINSINKENILAFYHN